MAGASSCSDKVPSTSSHLLTSPQPSAQGWGPGEGGDSCITEPHRWLWFQSCCCSVSQLCPTPRHPMEGSTPGFPAPQHLLELDQTHVHWGGDAIQPSYPVLELSSRFRLPLCCMHPLLLGKLCSPQVYESCTKFSLFFWQFPLCFHHSLLVFWLPRKCWLCIGIHTLWAKSKCPAWTLVRI